MNNNYPFCVQLDEKHNKARLKSLGHMSKEQKFALRVAHIKRKAKEMGIRLAPIIFALIVSMLCTKDVEAANKGQTLFDDMTPTAEEVQEAELYLSANYVNVPEEIEELCIKYGTIHNIAPELLEAMIWKESRFLPEVQGGACKGLMQVNPNYHKHRMTKVGAKDLFEPEDNIATGSDYLKDLIDENDSIPVALMLYNGDKRAYNPGFVSGYAKEILKISRYLEWVHK